MIDLFLRAATRDVLSLSCPFLLGSGTSGDGWSLDPIGSIVIAPGTYDPITGEELTPPVIDGRFHANLRCTEAVAELVPETVRVHPTSPVRVWA